MNFQILFAAIVFLCLLGIVVAPRGSVCASRLQLFRIFLPTWRFFEDVAGIPVLYSRTSEDGDSFSEWRVAFSKLPARGRLQSFVLNSEGNFLLAARSLLQQLESDLGDRDSCSEDELRDMVSFQLVTNLTRYSLRNSPAKYFQYQIARSSTPDSEIFLRSPVFELVRGTPDSGDAGPNLWRNPLP